MNQPTPLPNPDFSQLINMTNEGVKGIADDGRPGKDFSHYVFEETMKTIYGPEFFKWYNENIVEH